MLRLLSKAFGKGVQKWHFFLTGYRYPGDIGIPTKIIWLWYLVPLFILPAIWVAEPKFVYTLLLVYAAYKAIRLAWNHVGQNLLYLWDCLESQRGEHDVTVYFVEDAPPLMRQARSLASWDGNS